MTERRGGISKRVAVFVFAAALIGLIVEIVFSVGATQIALHAAILAIAVVTVGVAWKRFD
jgi:hypothetical protein